VKLIQTTILGGVFFLIPLAFVLMILGNAYEIALKVAAPIDTIIPLEDVAGVAMANVIAVLLLLLICFLAGLIAKLDFFSSRMNKVDGMLMEIMPGYAIAKSILAGMTRKEDMEALLTPVLVTFDDHQMIAFEIERTDTYAIVFLPGAPTAWSGSSIVVDLDRIKPLDVPTHQASALLRTMGRGAPSILDPIRGAKGNADFPTPESAGKI
jgi:uncharacterized membrane protein